MRRIAMGVAAAVVLSMPGSPAMADLYDAKKAGHPLRILAYVLHPVGVFLDALILRPAHWAGSREPLKTLSGHSD